MYTCRKFQVHFNAVVIEKLTDSSFVLELVGVTHSALNKFGNQPVMTSLRTENECQNADPNNAANALSFAVDSSRFPLDSSMRIIFTGYFNGFSVEVRSVDEMALLYHMGCFGKGSASRSKPRVAHDCSPSIMRKRQFLKRSYWFKKFAVNNHGKSVDTLLLDIDELVTKIVHDSQMKTNKDVIDLVSSDESSNEVCNDSLDTTVQDHIDYFDAQDKDNLVVIVPDSDSEEDYFANLKPKCCINKIRLPEKLMLTLQEAFFLSYGLGCLQVIDGGDNMLTIEQCWKLFLGVDKKFVDKYVVYHYFRSKGYIVKSGIKFGGDYVLYREGPGVMHADYIVVIKCAADNFSWVSILGHVRMASTTIKEVLIAEVVQPTDFPQKMPDGLNTYSVQEIVLTRNIPVTINEDID